MGTFLDFTVTLMKNLQVVSFFLLLSSGAYAGDFRWTPFRELLSSHENWISVVYEDAPFGKAVVQQGKRWRFVHKSAGLQLFEVIPLTISLKKGLSCTSIQGKQEGSFEMSSSVIDLNGLVVFNPFVSDNLPCSHFQEWQVVGIHRLEQDGLKISLQENSGLKREILIFPYSEPALAPASFNENIGAFSTPLGVNNHYFDVFKIKKDQYQRAFVRHDLSHPRTIIVNTEFPEKFLPLLESIVSSWNAVLGVKYFRLSSKPEDLNMVSCLRDNVLCLSWPKGLIEIPSTGVSATTHFAFDPLSGGVLGGLIDIVHTPLSLGTAPEKYIQELQNPTLEILASHFMKGDEYAFFAVAHPENYLKFLFNHEIGHFMGLKHNFFGFNGKSNEPYLSVMDYPPFILSSSDSKMGDLHRWDRETMEFIYRGNSISSDYRTCEEDNALGVSAIPNCNQFDIGATPIRWFQQLSSFAKHGIMTPVPGNTMPLAYNVGRFLLPNVKAEKEDTNIAKELICNDKSRDKALAYLKKTFGFELDCNVSK